MVQDNSMEDGESISLVKKEETEVLERPFNRFQSFSNANPIFLISSSLLFLYSSQLQLFSTLLDL